MSLSALDRRLVRLSAAIALGRWDELRALRHAAPAGEPDRHWREVLLQAHLFAGFPRAVEAAGVLAASGGLGPLEPGEREESPADVARGRALFDALYADQADAVRTGLEALHPELARWIEEHAYARVLARPGLAPDRRELCAVVALAATAQERQLASHARGAVRLGAHPMDVLEALAAVEDLLAPAVLARARDVVAHFAR
jgi:alkylhydroperoxidase/carboxymuconolactone decarboxylase family protein YurZ